MARQKVKTTVSRTKTRVKKGSSNGGYMQCNICGGTGVVKKRGKKR